MTTVVKTATRIVVAALIASAEQAKENGHPLDNYVLTDEMIAEAIEEGQKEKLGTVGLSLNDYGGQWGNYVTWRPVTAGFSLVIYTPYSWVGQQARHAAHRDEPFSPEDVTEGMKAHVLRVIAKPDLPVQRPGASRRGTSGVDHVIIRSTAEEDFEVLQPAEIEDGVSYSRAGDIVPYAKKTAVFDLQGVANIAKLDKKGEFIVVVIGTTDEEKMFKIKTKHLEKLR